MITDVKNPPPAPGTTAAPSPDVVHLSETLKKLERLKELIGEMPSMDATRVAALKKAIEEGSYQVNPTAVAHKLVELEAALKTLT